MADGWGQFKEADSWDAFSPVEGAQKDYGIDWSLPVADVRTAIGKLPEKDRDGAMAQWAANYVAKEREGGGVIQGLTDAARNMARGTLVGPFADEANAATQDVIYRATGGAAGAPYDETLAYQRATDAAIDKESPILSTVAKVAGGVASATPILKAPATLGEQVVRGATVGGVYGGVSGFGTAEGGFSNRASAAATGAAIGAPAGAVLAPAVTGLQQAAGSAGRFLTGAGRAQNADETIVQALRKDRISVADLESGLAPMVSARATVLIDPEDIARARQMLAAGAPARDVAKEFGTTVQTLNERLRVGSDTTPQSILDLSKEARPGAGANVTGVARGAASFPGEAKAMAQEALTARQISQQERLSGYIDRAFGRGDPELLKTKFNDALRIEANKAYTALYQQPDLLTKDLTDVVDVKVLKQVWSDAREIMRIKEGIDIGPTPGQHIPVRALDYLYRAVRDKADEAFRSGRTAIGDAYRSLRERIRTVADTNYPEYAEIRSTYSEAKRVQEAIELGQSLALRPGAARREAMKLISKMGDEERDLVRLGLSQKLREEVYSPSAGTNIADRLLRKGAVDLFDTLLPKNIASEFKKNLSRERTSTHVLREFQGSRTTPEAENIAQLKEDAALIGNALQGKFWSLLDSVHNKFLRGVTEKNAEQIIGKLLETDPVQLRLILRQLNRAEEAAAAREIDRVARAIGLTATAANLISAEANRPRRVSPEVARAQMRVMNEFREKGKELGSQRRLTDNLDRINEKSKTGIFQTGVVSPRKFATMLGMSLSDLDLKGDAEPAAFFEALNGMTPSDLVVKMKGAVTPPEWAGFLQVLPDMMSSKEGNAALFETMRVIHARQAAVSAMAGRRQRAGQGLDESFLDEMRSAREANPMPFNLPVPGAPNG